MALTKVTKHIVYGSQLIAHYGRDISDLTSSSSSYTQWGETVVFTPQYADSHLEIVFTGSMFTGSQTSTTNRYGNLTIRVNGTDEYIQEGAMGKSATNIGTFHFYNPRFSQHNVRQEFHHNNFGTGVYMNHIHAPGSTNAQSIQIMMSSDAGQFSIQCQDGYITVSEIAGNHHNLT
jgi:hypothetical protein